MAHLTNRVLTGNTVETVDVVSVTLDRDETRALLLEIPRIYHTEINDLLLTALAQSFAEWTGQPFLLVDLEGHGREEIFQDLDLSRTVGWFTTIFPVFLDLRGAASPVDALKRIKEQLRRIPRRGIGYGLLRYLCSDRQVKARLEALPKAEVVFNYLGQLDQTLAQSALFAPARESAGMTRSPRQQRSHLLEINASVEGKQLQSAWAFSTAVHRRETIERLAEGFVRALRELIAQSRSTGAHCYTPSDFPLVSLTQEQLDRLIGECQWEAPGPSIPASGRRQIEDIYPLSPVQQGMFFHHLSTRESSAYVEQIHCGLRGQVDAGALERAWQSALARHSILRTSFHLADLDAPVQVVHHSSALNIRLAEHDLRLMSPAEQRQWIADYLIADRGHGFDLSQAPLLRVSLLRLDEQLYRFVWTFHHLLLDGWSVARLFKETLTLYEAGSGRHEVVAQQALGPARPFRDYIEWLQRQDLGAAESFWRGALKGVRRPTPLGYSQTSLADVNAAPAGYDDRRRALTASTTRDLQTLARNHQLTLNTLAQGAWALVLSRQSGERDVLFGITVSGRPPELEGIETMSGMFINTLPVRARISDEQRLVDWLKHLQSEQVETRQYEYTPLGLVQQWADTPAGVGMFESLLVFENYPVSAATREQEGGIRIEGVDNLTRTKYPLTLVIAPGAELGLNIAYDRQRFSGESVGRMLEEMEAALRAMENGGMGRPLSALLKGIGAGPAGAPESESTVHGAGQHKPAEGETIVAPHEPLTLPRTDTEEKLAALWAEVMGLEQIDVNCNFFSLGGHSLLATQVISRVRAAFHGGIALRSLFDYPTVAQLAQHIDDVARASRLPDAPPLIPASGDRTRLPLSFAQQRLWILHQLEPQSVAYNIPIAARLIGPLDVDALQRTFDEIIRRHEVLRTTFDAESGEPAQVIAEAASRPMTIINLEGIGEDLAQAEMWAMLKAEAERPFDLRHDPLLRTTLIRKSEHEHVVLLTMHHIIYDGWSTNVLELEVSALYDAFARGEPSPLPELSVQYGDYAVWQRGWLRGEALEEQLNYWRQQLRGAATLRLPLDRRRPASQSYRGAAEEFQLGAEETRRLNELSRAEGCTMFMTALAAFQTLLHRYSGQTDIVVGTDIANRTRPEIEPLIGFFVNQLALRADLSDNPKFRQLLRRTRKIVLAAYERQDVPFEKVVETLKLGRDKGLAPLFQVKLVFQNTPRESRRLSSLRLEPMEVEQGATQLDLVFFMRETEQGLRGTLRYSADVFDASTIKRLLEHFESLLKNVIANPDTPVRFIELQSKEEEARHAAAERRRLESNLRKLRDIKSMSSLSATPLSHESEKTKK
jgi:non-ribosomal peptide synthase protein (TIGR01720 family)